MNELALFAGIHGIGLGLHRAFRRRGLSFRTVCYVEWDSYVIEEVLKPRIRDGSIDDAPIWDDIREFDGRPWAGSVDIVTGGFPCQDISTAGKGAGIEGERSGLFFELMRVVREVRPPLLLLENVPALLSRGMDRVAAELAASGYSAPWDCIPAAAVGANHRRDRVFILAYADKFNDDCGGYGTGEICGQRSAEAEIPGGKSHMADPDAERRGRRSRSLWQERRDEIKSGSQDVADASGAELALWQNQERLREFAATAGARQWSVEPDVGRVAHGIPHRVDRLRALGNAVVPQVAEYIGECLIKWLEMANE